MSTVWGFTDVVTECATSLCAEGFTERQARFLATVMVHAGVFVERQYCQFAGIAHGQKSHGFLARLVREGFAREDRPGARHQGRLVHVHHKRLYALIGQANNRHRRRAPRGRMVERLMLLDAVLDDPSVTWLGTEQDKARYFLARLADSRFVAHELPHARFGSGPATTVRLFPEKRPIGVDPLADRYVFTYLVTRSSPTDFRMFLTRYFDVLKFLRRWTVRVLVPKPFASAIAAHRHAADETLRRPLRTGDRSDLEAFFEQRRRAQTDPAFVPDAGVLEAARRFRGPRFDVLEKAWRQQPFGVLSNAYSPHIADQFDRGDASVEFVVLTRQYLHLGHLVGVA